MATPPVAPTSTLKSPPLEDGATTSIPSGPAAAPLSDLNTSGAATSPTIGDTASNNLAPVPARAAEAPGPAPQASTVASNIPVAPVLAGLTLDVGNAVPGPSLVATAVPGTIAPTTLSVAPDVAVPPAPTPAMPVNGDAGPIPLVISATTPVDTPSNVGTPTTAFPAGVPLCTLRMPPSQMKASSNTEAICDAIGLPYGNAVEALYEKLELFWENGAPITYSYMGGTDNQKHKIELRVNSWFRTKEANIQFVPVDQGGTIRISFDPNAGSWCYVGRAALNVPSSEATMNIVLADSYPGSWEEAYLINHELYHVAGMMHEYQGPKNGGQITLDEGAVYSCYHQAFGWDLATVKAQIIDVYNSGGVSNFASVNPASQLSYIMPAAFNLQHADVFLPETVIDLDKHYLSINYPPPAPLWPLDTSLSLFGVDAVTSQSIKDALAQGKITKMRAIFQAFLLSGRLAAPAPDSPDHGLDPTNPASEDLGWCGVDDPVDYIDDSASDIAVPSGALHGAFRNPGFVDELWDPYTTITYGFLQNERATDHRKQRLANVLRLYELNTSLTFDPVDDDEETWTWDFEKRSLRNGCFIRIYFGEREDRLKGTLGWAAFGQNQINAQLPPEVMKNPPPNSKWASVYFSGQPYNLDVELKAEDLDDCNQTLYHEIGHALGLHHEHYSEQSPLKREGDAKDVDKTLVVTKFDHRSVMLYTNLRYKRTSDERKNKQKHRGTARNTCPSPTDLDILRLLYPDNRAGGKFAAALETMRFSLKEQEHFLGLAEQAVGPGRLVDRNALRTLRSEIADNLRLSPRLSRRDEDLEQPRQYNPTDNPFDAPAHGIGPAQDATPASGPAPPVQAPGFLLELVTHLKEFFTPGGNQLFTLQFPGRFLDQASYAWDTASAGIYGQFIKPTAVNEAEFRLVDQLYDVAPNVAGPNGTNLSIVYEQLLNNLLPKYVDNGLAKQQDQIRRWLIRDVPMTQWIKDIMARQQARELSLATAIATSVGTASTSGDPDMSETSPANGVMFDISSKSTANGESLNRIELSELLMNEYLYAKQDWEIERDTLITQASKADVGTPESQKALNDLTRKLSHITDTRQAQLASKYADAVVRGYSHTIRQYMGYLDIANPAEALQNAKDSLREAAMSSLDGSMKVYPIQLTPLDWFAGLSTSFTLEDLTQDPEVIRMQINAKSQEIDTLNAQLVTLEMGGKGDPTALQAKVQAAQTALDTAQGTLSMAYSNNVIAMANTCLDAFGKLDTGALAEKLQVAKDVLADLPAMMETVQEAQNNLTASSRALSQLMAAQALAEASDTKQQQRQIQIQLQSLQRDLKELQTRWQVLTSSTGGVAPPSAVDHGDQGVPTTPIELPEESSSGGSRWQSITFTSDSKSRTANTKDFSTAATEQWSCNLWFASGSGSSTTSTGGTISSNAATEDTIDLAFRATLVTVDRGGWFQPQFFKESKAFYKVNPDITWTNATPQTIGDILKGDAGATGLMPGFPIAFLLAKDIVIRINHGATASADSKQTDAASAASSGGFLCFSYSNSRSSSSTSTASSFQSYNNGYIIKIPGPQILGYMIQVLDPDQTQFMPNELPAGFFIPDDEYDNTVTEPSHDIDPGGPKQPAAPAITQEKLREVLDKMLNDKIGELFDQLTPAAAGPST